MKICVSPKFRWVFSFSTILHRNDFLKDFNIPKNITMNVYPHISVQAMGTNERMVSPLPSDDEDLPQHSWSHYEIMTEMHARVLLSQMKKTDESRTAFEKIKNRNWPCSDREGRKKRRKTMCLKYNEDSQDTIYGRVFPPQSMPPSTTRTGDSATLFSDDLMTLSRDERMKTDESFVGNATFPQTPTRNGMYFPKVSTEMPSSNLDGIETPEGGVVLYNFEQEDCWKDNDEWKERNLDIHQSKIVEERNRIFVNVENTGSTAVNGDMYHPTTINAEASFDEYQMYSPISKGASLQHAMYSPKHSRGAPTLLASTTTRDEYSLSNAISSEEVDSESEFVFSSSHKIMLLNMLNED